MATNLQNVMQIKASPKGIQSGRNRVALAVKTNASEEMGDE